MGGVLEGDAIQASPSRSKPLAHTSRGKGYGPARRRAETAGGSAPGRAWPTASSLRRLASGAGAAEKGLGRIPLPSSKVPSATALLLGKL